MKYIYVTMTKTKSKIGMITRFFTRYPFSHVSISLDENLEEFYSFSRFYYNSPLLSGFNKEYRNHLAAKKDSRLYFRVYKIPLSNFEYKKIKQRINRMKRDKDLMYNYYSLLTMWILGGIRVYKSHTCCSFVAETLSLIKNIDLHKKPEQFFPQDFDILLSSKYTYIEKEFKSVKSQKFDYYQNIPFFKRMKANIYVLKEATYRLIFHNKTSNYNLYNLYINPLRIGNKK